MNKTVPDPKNKRYVAKYIRLYACIIIRLKHGLLLRQFIPRIQTDLYYFNAMEEVQVPKTIHGFFYIPNIMARVSIWYLCTYNMC